MNRNAPNPHRRSRAGLTFVEVIVSIGIVAGAAALVFSTISFLERVQEHNRDRLNGMEVAHRVVMQTIDDHKFLKNQAPRVEYDGRMYQFEVWLETLAVESGSEDNAASRRMSSTRAENLTANDRMTAQIHQITVEVYTQLPDGTRSPQPVARLVRSYNPMLGLGERGMRYALDQMLEATGVRLLD